MPSSTSVRRQPNLRSSRHSTSPPNADKNVRTEGVLTRRNGSNNNKTRSSSSSLVGKKTRHKSVPWILNHPIDQMVSRLSSYTFTDECIRNARDDYRLLETRITISRLGKGDTRESRAAILLRQSYAKSGGGDKLEWKDVAKLVGQKVNNLELLASKITNYLQPVRAASRKLVAGGTTTAAASSGVAPATKRLRSYASDNNTINNYNTTTNPMYVFTTLSIRLGCLMQHARKGYQLLTDIQQYVAQMSNVVDRRGYQYDMKRYGHAYQAACMYHILVPTSVASSSGKYRPSKGKQTNQDESQQQKQQSKNVDTSVTMSAMNHDYKLEDFLLPGLFTYLELQQVWKQVVQFSEEMTNVASSSSSRPLFNMNTKDSSIDRAKAPTAAHHRSSSAVVSHVSSVSTSWNNRSKLHPSTLLSASSVSRSNPEQQDMTVEAPAELKSPRAAFDEWHQHLWMTLQIDPNNEMEVAQVADDILRQHGLLQPSTTGATVDLPREL